MPVTAKAWEAGDLGLDHAWVIWTEAHHRQQWINGGETNPEHLDLLCSHHHHKVHEDGWIMTIGTDPDRTPWFYPPDGRPPLKGQRRPLFRPPGQAPPSRT
jgi:hypothetical protein